MNFPGGPGTILFSLGKKGLPLGALLAAVAIASAAPLDEISSLSLFRHLNLAKLKSGRVMVERGPVGDFPRGIYLESCYFIHAPMKAVGDSLLHWNPIDHQDVEVRQYGEFSLPPAADAFRNLQLQRSVPGDRWLLDETARVAQGGESEDLHITRDEAGIIRQQAKDPGEAWREILRRRSETAARRGLAAVAPYGTDRSISPGSEFRGLLSLAPKAAQHFRPITGAEPFAEGGKPASETVGYWETSKVRNHNTIQLGLFAAEKGADTWQLVDCLYYPSDTFFMSLNLFQLWQVEGGTLVWQIGFVSAPFRSYLGGFDRYMAGQMMTQETIDTIKAFRRDVEKTR